MKANWRGYVVACTILAFLCAYLSYAAFSLNSWGKWQKSSLLKRCWPLPPPFGCADLVSTKDVLTQRETDFVLMCLFCLLIYFWIGLLCMSLLAADEHTRVFGMERIAVVNSILRCFVIAVVFGIIICLIASYRLNAVYQSHVDKCVYDIAGFQPVYSSSFYLVVVASVFSFIGSLVVTAVCFDDFESFPLALSTTLFAGSSPVQQGPQSSGWPEWGPWKENWKQPKTKPKGTSRTTKQHIARNLLYPEDQQLNKMITFSSMPPDMEEVAADVCMKAVMRYTLEEDIAEHVKLNFEEKYGPTWQCAVGDSFGSCVHHRANEYVEVAMPKFSVLLYRCNEPPDNQNADAASTTTR